MSVLDVVTWPDPDRVLETRASEVTVFDEAFRKFVSDMHETMHASGGIGLAANQVGDLRRVIAIEIPWVSGRDGEPDEPKEWWHDKKFTFVNPIITKKAGKIKYQEGCLSFPEIFDFVDRSAEVWVKSQDEFGKEFEIHATGLLAICLQHEIDHIDGVVFINRMSRLKSGMIKKKLMRRGQVAKVDPVSR